MSFSELRQAARALLRAPGFTAIAVLTLALGTGATTAIFSVVNDVLLSPLPYDDPGELVVLGARFANDPPDQLVASPREYLDLVERSRTLQALAASWIININVTGGEQPERLTGALVTPNMFELLGAQVELGRNMQREDAAGSIGYAAIISHSAWVRLFNSAPDVIGRGIRLDDDPMTVIGVMPESFASPGEQAGSPVEVWVGIDIVAGGRWDFRDFRPVQLIGRLADGASLAGLRAELAPISAELTTLWPQSYPPERPWGFHAESLIDRTVGNTRPMLLILFASVAFVLLVACTNVANLLLARGSTRSREIAIRTALGSGRRDIIRGLLLESVLLGVTGSALGLAFASLGSAVLRQQASAFVPRLGTGGLDLMVLLFTAVVGIVASVAFGLVPALRTSRAELRDVMNQSTRGSTAGRSRLRDALVVAEIALSLVLLAGAGLMIRSFARLMSIDPGFSAERVMTMETWMPIPNDPQAGRFFTIEARSGFATQVIERLEAIPGVQQAAVTAQVPLRGVNRTVVGITAPNGELERASVESKFVSASYFDVMTIPVVQGRGFQATDNLQSQPVMMVNQAFAERYFAGQDPIGQFVTMGGGLQRLIVGVAGNARQQALDVFPQPEVFMPHTQFTGYDVTFLMKTTGEPESVTDQAIQAIRSVDGELPVFAIASLESIVRDSEAQRQLLLRLLSLFAALAMTLAAIGVYGVISYSVRQQTREIGIRMALGAGQSNVLGMVLRHGAALGGIGVVIGLAGSMLATGAIRGMLYETGALDPVALGVAASLALLVAVVASLVPARRAARVDPMVTMRAE